MCTPADRNEKVPQGLPMPESTAPILRNILKKGKPSAGRTLSLAETIKEPATPTRRSRKTSADEVLHRRCLNYNNQWVVQLSTTPGEPATLWGKIHYLGKQHLLEACQVTLTNGVVQNFTADRVSDSICENDADVFDDQSEHFQFNRIIFFLGVARVYDLGSLPPVWGIDSKESVAHGVGDVMLDRGSRSLSEET
jgi:hypothetical protein